MHPRLPFLLVATLGLVATTHAQELVCTPETIDAHQGTCACVVVRTAPVRPSLQVFATFDMSKVTVTAPPSSLPLATTDSNGEARFLVCCDNPALAGTDVVFQDLLGTHFACTTTVTVRYPDLQLGVVPGTAGASAPRMLRMQLTTNTPVAPTDFGVILASFTPGSFPLAIFNPADPRSALVDPFGLLVLHAAPFAAPDFTTSTATPLRVPALGATTPILFPHGLTVSASAPLIQRLSNATPIRFARRGSFVDRGDRMANARSFFPVLRDIDGRPVVAGGGEGSTFAQIATDRVEIYDPQTNTFTPSTQVMTSPRSLHTATELENGKWLITGGVDLINDPLASAEIYDPATGRFTPVADMEFARMGHAATLLPDGDVLITGGFSLVSADVFETIESAQATSEIFTLDATGCSGTFSRGPDMQDPRAGHHAMLLPDDRVYLMGGIGPNVIGPLTLPKTWESTEFYDGNAFTSGPDMPSERAIFAVTDISTPAAPDRFLVAGGLGPVRTIGAPTTRADIYQFVPGMPGSWTRAGDMAQPRGIQAAFRFGNQVVQLGGLNGRLVTLSGMPNSASTDTTEIYDIVAGTWRSGPTMSAARGAFGAYRDPNGAVHLVGGVVGTQTTSPVVRSTDWYHH